MVNRKFMIHATKTYATEENVDKAIAKFGYEDIRHFIMKTDDNRFFPVFIGSESINRGVHFNFNVVA